MPHEYYNALGGNENNETKMEYLCQCAVICRQFLQCGSKEIYKTPSN